MVPHGRLSAKTTMRMARVRGAVPAKALGELSKNSLGRLITSRHYPARGESLPVRWTDQQSQDPNAKHNQRDK